LLGSDLKKEIWIIGVGRFGHIAFQRLSEAHQDLKFVLVDLAGEKLRHYNDSPARLEMADGIAFLDKNLAEGQKPDWIVPALPVHLAAEWLLLHLGPQRLRRVPLPAGLAQVLPNPFFGSEGNLYVSHADFRCPEDCDEPRNICTITRRARKQNMFELLGNLSAHPFKALNIRSRQLGPGIGGYRPEQLLELRENVELARGPVLVSTACRCHGVLTSLEPI
jgi:hypothetical protein